jgi:cell division protein FtsQ
MSAPTIAARRAWASLEELPVSRRFMAGFAVLAVAAVGWLGWSWLRDSSLVQVESVKISGLTTRDAPAIRRTLRQAATRMTTLNYSEQELRRAVEPFPAVQSMSVDADLPHKLVISVREHRPVAALISGESRRVAVASDGTLLPHERGIRLPTVKTDSIPGDGRLGASVEEGLVRVLAGAPEELRPLLERAYRTKDGVRVAIARGPTLRFGAPIRLAAKWAAAARVLADTAAAGASTIDLRIPERPSAAYDEAVAAQGTPAQMTPAQETVQTAAVAATQTAAPVTTTP